jgi:hypothetical protein
MTRLKQGKFLINRKIDLRWMFFGFWSDCFLPILYILIVFGGLKNFSKKVEKI